MSTLVTPTDPRARIIYLSPEARDGAARFALFLGPGGKLQILRVPELDDSTLSQAVIATLTQITNLAVQTKKPRLRPSLEAAARAIVEHYWEELAAFVPSSAAACGAGAA
ncbi:MAG: hypothetical protein WAJ85_06030 [Candidatus Baltobacteraceae bacterium]|jgi:hypothetical protein